MKNRKASYDYNLITPYIAGIILEGTEVKLLQDNKVSFNGAFCYFEENELFVKNLTIGQKDFFKLLLKKRELKKIKYSLIDGYTIVPYSIFRKNNKFKVEIYLAKGKKQYDKKWKEKYKQQQTTI